MTGPKSLPSWSLLIRIAVWRVDWKVRVDAGPVRTLFSLFRQ